jgi:hypothetical protein
MFTEGELKALSETIFSLGARKHVLQAFRPDGCRDEDLLKTHDPLALNRLLQAAAAADPRVAVRGV